MIHPVVSAREAQVRELCRRHGVSKLELFGSAARGTFDPARSDLDFLVEFRELPPIELSNAYFGLLFGLEDLFERPVDLVMRTAIDNPYFLESIERGRVTLYAA